MRQSRPQDDLNILDFDYLVTSLSIKRLCPGYHSLLGAVDLHPREILIVSHFYSSQNCTALTHQLAEFFCKSVSSILPFHKITHRWIFYIRYTVLLFELCTVVYLDRPFTPIWKGSMDFFPRASGILHLEHRRVLFWCPWSTLRLGSRCCSRDLRI